MPIAPIMPKGIKPISVTIPNNVIKQLNSGTYIPNTQVVATAKDGKKFVTTLTNIIDWIINTGTKVADLLNNLGVINTRQLQNQIPQFDTVPVDDGTGESEIVIKDGNGKVLQEDKPYVPPPTDKPKTVNILGLEVTNTEIAIGAGVVYLLLKKK